MIYEALEAVSSRSRNPPFRREWLSAFLERRNVVVVHTCRNPPFRREWLSADSARMLPLYTFYKSQSAFSQRMVKCFSLKWFQAYAASCRNPPFRREWLSALEQESVMVVTKSRNPPFRREWLSDDKTHII